jgi:hypothetical protein
MADAPPDPQIRLLRPGDDPDAQLDLAERAFGPGFVGDRDRRIRSLSRLIAAGRSLGAFCDGRPAAGAAIQDMRQWWLGRPGADGRGVQRHGGTGAPRPGHRPDADDRPARRDRGAGLSAVGAVPGDDAAVPVAGLGTGRGQGHGGYPGQVAAPPGPARRQPPEAGTVPATGLRRAGPADAEAVVALLGRVHEAARDCGPITWDTDSAADWLADPGLYAYLAEDGFLAYRWQRGNQDLYAERAEAISARTARALWTQLGSHASIAEKVYARTGPASAFWWLTRERDADIAHRSRWMLRVVDAPAAIAARGFPAATSLTVPLRITDETRPANSGRWRLTVAGGAGTLDPLGPDAPAVTLGARGLAALYAGTPLVTLRQAGLAAGGTAADDAALDAAFAATPYMLDAF